MDVDPDLHGIERRMSQFMPHAPGLLRLPNKKTAFDNAEKWA
jgi:hypothetical protein